MATADSRIVALGLNPLDVFVLYPENAAFLSGERPIPVLHLATETVGVYLVGGVALLIVGFISVGKALSTAPPRSSGNESFDRLIALFSGALLTFTVLLIPLGTYCVFVAFRFRQFRRRQQTEWHTASLIVGKLVSCSATPRPRSAPGSNVSFEYQYQSPFSGQTITAGTIVARNDLTEHNLPKSGSQLIVVVYNPIIPPANVFNRSQEQGFLL